MYLEKYMRNPKHIEFQMLADKYGNTTAATIPLCLTDYYRQRGKTPTTLSLDDILLAGNDSPSAELENKLAAACLRLAIRHLTEIQQQVIIGKSQLVVRR